MNGKKLQKNSISGLMALLVLCIFAVCILTVLLLGADTYQSLSKRNQKSYTVRTGTQYLASKVRQAESGGQITVDSVGSKDALVLSETIEGERYQTWIYCWDGWICEYFTEAGLEKPDPEWGESVLEAESMDLSMEDGLLTVILTADSQYQELVLALRGGPAAEPAADREGGADDEE